MDSGAVALLASVTDTGCGISQEDINELFTPYKQARHGVEYTGSSSGLGLYISRGIARQMGGDLTASSDGLGKGSTFTFEFFASPVSAKEVNHTQISRPVEAQIKFGGG